MAINKLKSVILQQQDGNYSPEVVIAPDAKNVYLDNNQNLQEAIGNYNLQTDGGSIKSNLNIIKQNILDLNTNKAGKNEVGKPPKVASSSDEMVDTEAIYVYTGATANGWTNGNWYSYSDGQWRSGGSYIGNPINVDSTLTQQGAAADAKATGEIVKISATQPIGVNNRIWVDTSEEEEEYEIPTMSELNQLIANSIKSSNITITAENYTTIITNVDDQPVNTIYAYAANLQSNITNLPSNRALTIMNFAQKSTGGLGQVMLAVERNGSDDYLYFRTIGGSPAVWSSWVKVANNSDVEDVREALDNFDIETDETLSISGKPADAKAAGDAINDVKADLGEVKDAVFDDNSAILHEASADYIYSNALNNAYVWMLKTPFPQYSIPKMTIYGKSAAGVGSGTIYFLKKNADGSYSVVNSITITTVIGTNAVNIPQGLTDNGDIYVAFYSTDHFIVYNSSSSSPRRKEYARFSYADPSPEQISVSGSYMMDFNVAIEYDLIDNHIADLQSRVDAIEATKFVIVDASGNGDYTSLLTALQTEPENTVIFVRPGVYNQDMTSCLKKRVIVIGADRNQCIIRDTDGRYGHHPLYISCGYFENLTIKAPYVSGESQEIGVSDMGAYAVHIDTDDDYAIGKQCEFHHCNISSDFFPAVGLGMRKDATYIFNDCNLTNGQIANRGDYSDEGTLGALYFHDSNGEQGNQYIVVKDCVLKSKLAYAMCMYEVNRTTQNNRVYCNFINNVLYSETGHYTDTVWFRRNPLAGIFSIVIGYGNSISSLNN